MSLYPSLEDMKVDQLHQAQRHHEQASQQPPALQYPHPVAPGGQPSAPRTPSPSLYPQLGDYMGLSLTPELVAQNMPVAVPTPMPVGVRQNGAGQMQVAPISGDSKGLVRAEIKQGIRPIILCKDENGKLGLRVRHVNNGLFVALVQNNSTAALAGLRFGDQILQIDGKSVAGWDNDKAHRVFRDANPKRIELAVRDRPFERTITMQKDSVGYIGFVFKDGRIKSIVKDSSAARNGILTDHQLIEINGQNVVGLKDNEVGEVIDAGGRTVTVTIMPCFLFDHIKKCMGNSLIKKLMDHSIPDL
ncbi:syntenin-1 [Patella vulgata]|uniref:syntenin-1 n=1 Tax=Patella vulgata TaxID=6465 RepID=UPI0021807079|nr:syntenin-1 [Patella vulgata]XP_050402321.1 syntenin-1 [Patella vulgata]XP_050402322.1 syntenin-1 [Patella vulgata]